MKVLIVDDERTSLLVLKRQLEKWENEVLSASSAREGLRFLNEDPSINLLITDWVMPEMDGLMFCREVRKQERSHYLPIMMLTALTDTQDLVKALNAGADAFLSKPINPMELKAQIRVMERVLDLELRLETQIRKLEEAHAQIKAMAETDELTKLPNRRSVLQRLNQEVNRAERYGHPLSIILIDIDHFKDVNDTYGHPAGDSVLVQTASRLSEAVRESDLPGRYGGEEFLGVLAQTDLTGAQRLAERVRESIESHAFDLGDGTVIRKTASLGAATWKHGCDSASEMIARADSALYQAKEGGRNRVVLAEERT